MRLMIIEAVREHAAGLSYVAFMVVYGYLSSVAITGACR